MALCAVDQQTKQSGWVWYSSDDSIARGQISVLALVEIPLAMAFFWWISSISPWPWLTLIGLMAAPVLLLRSPESVEEGVKMLRRYWDKGQLMRRKTSSHVVLLAFLTGGVILWLNAYWLVDAKGGVLVLRHIINAVSMLAIVFALLMMFLAPVLAAIAIAILGAGAGGFARADFFHMELVFGVLVRVMVIRVWVTSKYWRQGMGVFFRNCRETYLVIDARHLPELLPGSGQVDPMFSLSGRLKWNNTVPIDEWVDNAVFRLLMGVVVYIYAMLYRWNLKASAWLWGPVAIIFSPIIWGSDEEMRSKTAYWTTWALQSVLWLLLSGLACWLLMPVLPQDVLELLPKWLQVLAAYVSPPTFGVRYLMLWFWAVSLLLLLLYAYPIRAAHGKALEGAGDFDKGYSEELKAALRKMAVPVRRCLRWNLALTALTIWTFALWWALQRWPDELQHAVWAWLRPWL